MEMVGGTKKSHEDPAERIAGQGGCHPGVSAALRRAGTGQGGTRAHPMCFEDARGRLLLARSHLLLTQTEMVQEDLNSGRPLVLKRQPGVAIHASLMKTCPVALLGSYHACY